MKNQALSSFECLDRQGQQREYAQLVEVSDATVSNLRKRGVLQDDGTLLEWLRADRRALSAAATGRGDGDGASELTQARIREANAKAFRTEVETAKDLGLLVPIRDVEPALRNWAARGAQAIDSAAQRIIDGIQSEFGIKLEDRHVREHLRTAQRDIAAYADQFGDAAEASGSGVDPTHPGADG